MSKFLLAIDQGTTGSTALVIDIESSAKVIGRATVNFEQHYPKPGWVEHDLNQIWSSVREAVIGAKKQAVANNSKFSDKEIAAIGITNQRETLCAFSRKTGEPAARAIVWQCRRSTPLCAKMQSEGLEPMIKGKTGLVLDPYFSGSKLSWLMENNQDVATKAKKGEVVFGTIDTYLLYRLSGCSAYATEPSNASRTMLFELESGDFNPKLLEMFKVPSRDVLPQVKDSAGVFGKTKGLDFLPDDLPISGILGDQQAALAGQTCFSPGEGKCTYGTGAFLLLNTGDKILRSKEGMLTTVAWSLKSKRTFALEGSSFIAGAAVQFIRDQMRFVDYAKDSEDHARDVEAAPEIYFVPALAGLGAPYWDPNARGAFLGLSRGTTSKQLIRAALEGIAFQVCDLLEAMKRDFASEFKILRVDGGAVANNLLMQTQANLANINVDRPMNIETTAYGAAMFAGLGAGVYSDIADLKNVRIQDQLFKPDKAFAHARQKQLDGWKRAVKAVQVFAGME